MAVARTRIHRWAGVRVCRTTMMVMMMIWNLSFIPKM